MAISPNQEERLANEIRRIYEDAEFQLLRMIAQRLMKDGEIADWQSEKLALITGLLRDSQKVTDKLNRKIPKEIEKIIELAYLAGDESAVQDLKDALATIKESGDDISEHEQIQMALFPGQTDIDINIDATMATFGGVNTEAITALAGATTKTITEKHVYIVRSVDDIFRSVISEVAGSTLTGAETRLEVAQRALNKFADKGIKVFRTASGANYDMASYAEMATRSAIGQASIQGHITKMTSFGFDLVQISDHHEECEICRPWEGKILSVSGNDREHPSLAEATADGLFHPRCGHRANTYFEGLTEPLGDTEDPDGYEERQEQRYLERGIRGWKKRQAVAMTPKEKAKADAKVAEWKERMDHFIDETGRRRKREREQIKSAR
jgi:hypothetical protein